MADLDTQDQEIKDLTETFNTHKHPHTHPYHRHFTPPPPVLASNNNVGGGGRSSGGGGSSGRSFIIWVKTPSGKTFHIRARG